MSTGAVQPCGIAGCDDRMMNNVLQPLPPSVQEIIDKQDVRCQGFSSLAAELAPGTEGRRRKHQPTKEECEKVLDCVFTPL